MKRNKGFTLIELLAVIIILGVLAVIVIPVINNSIKSSKEKSYQNQIKNILDSARNYGTSIFLGYDNNIEKKITIEQLQEQGFFEKKDILNPKTGEKLVGCVIYKWMEDTKQYEYRFDEACQVGPLTLKQAVTKGPLVTTGAGVYKISDTEYRYRGGCELTTTEWGYVCIGADPINNYISINGQRYRIIGSDSQGVKVISEKILTEHPEYDIGGVATTSCTNTTCPRNNANNTFCQVTKGQYYGCSVYAAVKGDFTAGSKTGTVTQNSNLYNYLNINGTEPGVANLRDKSLLVTWNIGAVTEWNKTSVLEIINQEKKAIATFKLGLINTSDYISGSLDTNCQKDSLNYSENAKACRNNNWLFDSESFHPWTINPWASTINNSSSVWAIRSDTGYLYNFDANGSYGIRSVAYLSSDIIIKSGEGTSTNPWVIE